MLRTKVTPHPAALIAASLLLPIAACNGVTGVDDVVVEEGPAPGVTSGGGATGSSGTPTATGSTGTNSTGTNSTGTTSTGSGMGGAGGMVGEGGAGAGASASSSSGGMTDPLAAARTNCLDKINELRATVSKPPLMAWTSGQTCADMQAVSDENSGTPHGSFGSCGESAQNECLGAGVNGVEGCIQQMWDERLFPGCSGCAACSGSIQQSLNCPDCDFYGTETGQACGHFVNMNADYFSEVACGFNPNGGWVVMNFR